MEDREGKGGVQLVVHWMEGQPPPDAVLDLLACNWRKKRSLPRCVFVANGLRCTDMCKLAECENRASTSDIEESCVEDVGRL